MNTTNKITTAWNRYLDWLLRERVHVFFQAPLGRDPWSLAAIPSRRFEELGVLADTDARTTRAQNDCTVTEQGAVIADLVPAGTGAGR